MMQSILVASDLTDNSDEVVRTAAALAGVTGAELHVLHAFEFEGGLYSVPGHPAPTFQKRTAEAARALDDQIARVVRDEVKVATREVVIYIAFKALRDRARTVNADLIVLGPHRARQVGDRFLGGTTDRVLRSVDVPCLIVRGPLSLPLRKVLAPIDLSEPAIRALDIALKWCASLSPTNLPVELTALHVIPRVLNFADVPLDYSGIGVEVKKHVDAHRARLPDAHGLAVRQEVRWADSVADEIVNLAHNEKVNLVVLGTHGRGALKRALIGSVALGVARAAPCPVLLVPPAMWQGE